MADGRPPEVGGAVVPPAFRPQITTRRLRLRPLTPGDAGAIAAGLGDAAVARMLARVPHPYPPHQAAAYIAFATQAAAGRQALILAIERNGVPIGCVSLGAIPYRNRLGYWLVRAHWGNGYAGEAVAAFVRYAFVELGVGFVRAGVYADNGASRRLLARFGFRPLGPRTGHSLARGGRHEHIATILTRARFTEMTR
jgi:8-oxo-dGTP diphosphatase